VISKALRAAGFDRMISLCYGREKKGSTRTISEKYERFEKDKKESGTYGHRMVHKRKRRELG
jgi:hypothetical protein